MGDFSVPFAVNLPGCTSSPTKDDIAAVLKAEKWLGNEEIWKMEIDRNKLKGDGGLWWESL